MGRDFDSVRQALASGSRWIAVEGMDPGDAAGLFECASAFIPGTKWILLDELAQGDLRFEWKASPPPLAVVDALHLQESQAIAAPLKMLLKTFAQTRFLFLVPGSVGKLEIPSFYGAGTVLYGESLVSLDAIGKADGELLRHARKIKPSYQAEDLVLGPVTALKFQEALSYIRTKAFCETNWGFKDRHARGNGVTVLFHGASGTGKTMAAEVLAAEMDLPLYQVDLSSLVSKWVGETEKNLRAVFRAAEGVKGILLFDEGDAIFGNRTDVKSSQDRHSNMEVNYLLQEIERFTGILLLSTNHFNNMDPAFLRRFTYTIIFGAPASVQRKRIWERNIPAPLPLADDVNTEHLAEFGLTGGSILNCIRHGAARAAARGMDKVFQEDFLWSIKRELQKHNLELSREVVGEEFWRKVAPEWEHRQLPSPWPKAPA